MRPTLPWWLAAIVWCTSIVTLAATASGILASAQGLTRQPPTEARVLSGRDVGFRIEGKDPRTGRPTGTWVVRIDGRWVPVGSTPSVVPAR